MLNNNNDYGRNDDIGNRVDGGAGAGGDGGAGGDVLAGPQAAGRAGEGDEEPAPGAGPAAGYKVYGSWVKNQENIVNLKIFVRYSRLK